MARSRQKSIQKIFIANRGEIAVRIIKSCRELGIATVAGYSEADRRSLHVQLADEAVCLGPASPLESYLNIEAIIGAAKETHCDAVHPGYGFLSENADLADAIVKAGITFIGPATDVLRIMGSKIKSRKQMEKAGVPIVPGTVKGSDVVEEVVADAKKLDGPIMLKASAGGGGKGMRLVTDASQLESLVESAIGEAISAFGDGTVYIEKQIENPRHIEVQILADQHGNTVHLFERECSIQRRHQKLLEETPSPALDDALRERITAAAIAAAKSVGYENAGTVEFLLDSDGEFYFLEMNTRVQVEHAITEVTTGIDIVKWQILIAQGEKLAFEQSDITQHGHAIECRIYAEDPRNRFIPSCGSIDFLREPWGPGVRNDSGIYEGWEVSPYYDPILSKLVAFAESRDEARRRMLEALEEYVVHGIHTTVEVHQRILESDAFIKGKTDTGFVDAHLDDWFEGHADVPDEAFVVAVIAEELLAVSRTTNGNGEPSVTPWQTIGNWQIGEGD